MKKEYIASGVVYGKTWGGGFGAYPASVINAKSKTEILKQAGQDLKSGALDSGMGFEFESVLNKVIEDNFTGQERTEFLEVINQLN
jgi:hypothetical protein